MFKALIKLDKFLGTNWFKRYTYRHGFIYKCEKIFNRVYINDLYVYNYKTKQYKKDIKLLIENHINDVDTFFTNNYLTLEDYDHNTSSFLSIYHEDYIKSKEYNFSVEEIVEKLNNKIYIIDKNPLKAFSIPIQIQIIMTAMVKNSLNL